MLYYIEVFYIIPPLTTTLLATHSSLIFCNIFPILFKPLPFRPIPQNPSRMPSLSAHIPWYFSISPSTRVLFKLGSHRFQHHFIPKIRPVTPKMNTFCFPQSFRLYPLHLSPLHHARYRHMSPTAPDDFLLEYIFSPSLGA